MRETLQRVILAVLALTAVELGLWATFAPRSFYDDFPGGGRSWVSADGPFNEHLVRDVGALWLALAVLTIVALVRPSMLLVSAVAVAWLVEGVPHLVYHLRHLDVYDGSDKVGTVASLSIGVLLPIALLVLARVAPGQRRDAPPVT
jgi:hypothetical protein